MQVWPDLYMSGRICVCPAGFPTANRTLEIMRLFTNRHLNMQNMQSLIKTHENMLTPIESNKHYSHTTILACMEVLEWYVELYPECRPHYRPFGVGYGIYVRVSILYTTMGHPTHGRTCPSLGRIFICDNACPAGYV